MICRILSLEMLKNKLKPLVEKRGLIIFDIKFTTYKNKSCLKVYVDKPEGGVNLEECVILNQEISQYLDDLNIFEDSYILEVSSPGIDWPLRTLQDFRRVKNKKVRLILITGQTIEGELIEVEERKLILKDKEEVKNFNLAEIKEGKEIIEL